MVVSKRPVVLFVCVHNAGRSQMAAGFLGHLAKGSVDVLSAGSEPADLVNPVAVEAMAEVGIDVGSETPKLLEDSAVHRRTLSSRWAAATPARSIPGSATRIGTSPTQPASRWWR